MERDAGASKTRLYFESNERKNTGEVMEKHLGDTNVSVNIRGNKPRTNT